MMNNPSLCCRILRQALEMPDEQKARLLEEMLQHELGSSAENNRPFLEKLDEALTSLPMIKYIEPADALPFVF